MNVKDVRSTAWSISLEAQGEIVQGSDDINQCIGIILRTIPGTDPFRPTFGSNAFKYQDKPINVAVPNIRREILTALDLWEKRITVTNVKSAILATNEIKFTIEYTINNSVKTGQTDVIYGIT